MAHIHHDINDYIDPWINPRLVHDLYLKSLEGHFLMINYENLSCKIFLFFFNILPQVATLARVVDYFPLQSL